MNTKLRDAIVVGVSAPPQRFTLNEWYLNTRHNNRTCDDQLAVVDKMLAECDRIRDEIGERTDLNKNKVDHKLDEKIKDLEFIRREIALQRSEVTKGINSFNLHNDHIFAILEDVGKSAKMCKECCILRESRQGIDLCRDDVERELGKEMEVLEGAKKLLTRAQEQVNEQVRRLRSLLYLMDRDAEAKENAQKLDGLNYVLSEENMMLFTYHGFTPLNPATVTAEEWQLFTQQSIERAATEINSSRSLCDYINNIVRQAVDDLRKQNCIVNEAFRRRIAEMKEVKSKLEMKHSETIRHVKEMMGNITKLQDAIARQGQFLALAHTRLGNRAQMSGMELCKDLVEAHLTGEVDDLRQELATFQRTLAEAEATLRYLLRMQLRLEEDINIKTNTLKIDEVDCLVLRQSIQYHDF